MNPAGLFVLAGTQGGETRLCVLEALDDHAQTTHQLAETVDASQSQLDHHLDVLESNGLIEKQAADTHAPYQITQRARADWDDIEELLHQRNKTAPSAMGILMVYT